MRETIAELVRRGAYGLPSGAYRPTSEEHRTMTISRELLQRVCDGDGPAAADLAQLIWDQSITDPQVVALMQHHNANVRGCVAWAVDDAGRPPMALEYLINHGLSDSEDRVRVRALGAVTTYRGMSRDEIAAYLRPFVSDPSVRVRHFVECTLAGRGRADRPPRKSD